MKSHSRSSRSTPPIKSKGRAEGIDGVTVVLLGALPMGAVAGDDEGAVTAESGTTVGSFAIAS